jgi:hypothetical protein
MAVRIHQTRRRRPAGPDVADVTSVWMDESALLEATDHVIDKIEEATATS